MSINHVCKSMFVTILQIKYEVCVTKYIRRKKIHENDTNQHKFITFGTIPVALANTKIAYSYLKLKKDDRILLNSAFWA